MLRSVLTARVVINPCLFCPFFVVCCSVFCFAFRFGSLVLCPPLLPPLVAPPPSRSPSCPLGVPPLKGERLPRAKLICPWLPSFGGTLHWGGASLRSSLVRRLRGGSFVFFFSRKVLAPAGGKFGGSLRQIKGSPHFAPLSLGRPLINPSSLLRRAAPAPAAPPALKIVRLLVCFFAFVSMALVSPLSRVAPLLLLTSSALVPCCL